MDESNLTKVDFIKLIEQHSPDNQLEHFGSIELDISFPDFYGYGNITYLVLYSDGTLRYYYEKDGDEWYEDNDLNTLESGDEDEEDPEYYISQEEAQYVYTQIKEHFENK